MDARQERMRLAAKQAGVYVADAKTQEREALARAQQLVEASQARIERTANAMDRSAAQARRQQQVIDRESARSQRDRQADEREQRWQRRSVPHAWPSRSPSTHPKG